MNIFGKLMTTLLGAYIIAMTYEVLVLNVITKDANAVIVVHLTIGFIILGIFYFVSRKIIIAPLSKLINAAKEIKNGNYEVKVDYKSNDEFGELSKVFNEMAGSLMAFKVELFNRAISLEADVDKRVLELRQANERLAQLKERMDFVISSGPAVIYTSDAGYYSTFTFVSDNVALMLGYEASEFLKPGFWANHIHPDDMPGVLNRLNSLSEFNRSSQEYRFLHKNGLYLWLHGEQRLIRDHKGEPLEIIGYWADITEKKTMDMAFMESEEKFRSLAESTTAGIVIISGPGFCYINSAYEEMTGYSKEELMEMNFWDIFHPDYKRFIKEGGLSLQVSSEPTEVKIIRKDGQERWLMLSGRVFSYGGKPAFVGTSYDITDMKKMEIELKEANVLAEAGNRAKSDFIANVSHELNTPLNSIIGFSGVLLDAPSDPLTEGQRRYIENILTSGRRLHGVFNNMMALARLQSGAAEADMKELDVGSCIGSVLSLFEEKAWQKSITVSNEILDGGLKVLADDEKLRQVLYVIFDNAFKFNVANGFVKVSALVVQRESKEFLEITIEDSGIGIREDEMQNLFTLFHQAESPETKRFEGVGLGLVLADRILKLIGGDILIDSKYGLGSSFTVSIPCRSMV